MNHVVHTHPCTLYFSHAVAPAVRHKAKDIISFLQDDERLREARKAAKTTRDKYVGYSSEEAHSKYSECMSISRVSSSLLGSVVMYVAVCFDKASVFVCMGTVYGPCQLSGYETNKLCAPLPIIVVYGPCQLSGYETSKFYGSLLIECYPKLDSTFSPANY